MVKLDPAGNLVWTHRFGAGGTDAGYDVAVDADGNVIVTGYFENTVDFDPGSDPHERQLTDKRTPLRTGLRCIQVLL